MDIDEIIDAINEMDDEQKARMRSALGMDETDGDDDTKVEGDPATDPATDPADEPDDDGATASASFATLDEIVPAQLPDRAAFIVTAQKKGWSAAKATAEVQSALLDIVNGRTRAAGAGIAAAAAGSKEPIGGGRKTAGGETPKTYADAINLVRGQDKKLTLGQATKVVNERWPDLRRELVGRTA